MVKRTGEVQYAVERFINSCGFVSYPCGMGTCQSELCACRAANCCNVLLAITTSAQSISNFPQPKRERCWKAYGPSPGVCAADLPAGLSELWQVWKERRCFDLSLWAAASLNYGLQPQRPVCHCHSWSKRHFLIGSLDLQAICRMISR